MKQSCLIILMFVCLIVSFGLCNDVQKGTPEHARYLRDGAQAKLTLRIMDEDGMPVSGAKIKAHFQMAGREGITGLSNTNGLFAMEGKTRWKMHYGVDKDGYYSTSGEFAFGSNDGIVVKDDKWQPWNPEVVVVLRPILNSIPMYAKSVRAVIPLLDHVIGFDLLKADWVAPYGDGKVADVSFYMKKRYEDIRNFDSSLDLVLTNVVDGLQETSLQVFGESKFKLLRFAPDNRYTITNLVVAESSTNYFKPNESLSFYFRVRTVTNEAGQVVSAMYGKIRSYIGFDVRRDKTGIINFTYYLNPTPNDRNLEFDPKRNLFKNLKSTEQAMEP